METVAQVSGALQQVLGGEADRAAQQTGAVQRVRKFTGATLVQTLVLGWLAQPAATLTQLCQMAAGRGVSVSPQGLDARFTPALAACLQQVLAAAARQVVTTTPAALGLLARFPAVVVLDSTLIRLPDALAATWAGAGGGNATSTGTQAQLKVQVGVDLCRGRLVGPTLHAGRVHDQRSAPDLSGLPAEALVLTDLGYFSLERLAEQTAAGQFWVTRAKVNTKLRRAGAEEVTTIRHLVCATPATVDLVDLPVALGAQHRLPCRLVGTRVPAKVAAAARRKAKEEGRKHGRTPSADRLALADWFIVVTNLSVEQATAAEVLVLARVRWQVELVFRRWKSVGLVDESRSAKPDRIHCEVLAKLIAMVVAHWATLVGGWAAPHRSLWLALTVVQRFALSLAVAWDDPPNVAAVLVTCGRVQQATCHLATRSTHPALFQLLGAVP